MRYKWCSATAILIPQGFRMKQMPSAPPVKAKSLLQQQSDFTAEGAPAPAKGAAAVAATGRRASTPAWPARAARVRVRKLLPLAPRR